MEKERTYFMRRAAQERSAADHASGMLERRYRERVGISIAGTAAEGG